MLPKDIMMKSATPVKQNQGTDARQQKNRTLIFLILMIYTDYHKYHDNLLNLRSIHK